MRNPSPRSSRRKSSSPTPSPAPPSPAETSGIAAPPKAPEDALAFTPRAAWGLTIAGGVAGGLAFDPMALRPLIVAAPAAIFLASDAAATPLRAGVRAFAGGACFYLISISWLMSLWRFHLGAPAGIVAVALYMAAYSGAAAWATRRWFGALGAGGRYAVFASLWLLGEAFRTYGRLANPLSELGHAWAPIPWAIQSAEFFGELGVGAQILLWSAGLVSMARGLRSEAGDAGDGDARSEGGGAASARRRELRIAAVCLSISLMILGMSALRYRAWEGRLAGPLPEGERELRVAALQPVIDQHRKMATNDPSLPEATREAIVAESYAIHERLVRESVPPETDLLVMPESTFSEIGFAYDRDLHFRIENEMLARVRGDLLFGADRLVWRSQDDFEMYNAAWFVRSGVGFQTAATQDKMRLVPFGEHLPYFDLIPGFNSNLVGILGFREGREVRVFETTSGARFGALICFESTFADSARRLARAGAGLLTVITNDGWYGRSAGPAQHHHLSILRAIETRRPLVRSANTGISSVVAPSGRILATLPLMERGVVTATVRTESRLTFFARWGNLWLLLACGGVPAAGARTAWRRKRG